MWSEWLSLKKASNLVIWGRSRTCNNPVPSPSGRPCEGPCDELITLKKKQKLRKGEGLWGRRSCGGNRDGGVVVGIVMGELWWGSCGGGVVVRIVMGGCDGGVVVGVEEDGGL